MSEWVVRHDVPVLDCFTKQIGGRLVKSDPDRLRKIAAGMNAITERTGDEFPIVVGHTDDGKPEWEQPPIVGYASDFYVGELGGEPALLARTWKLHRECKVGAETLTAEEVLKRFPRRSGEWHTKDDILDPISILGATSPMRHLSPLRMSCAAAKLDPAGSTPMDFKAMFADPSFCAAIGDIFSQFAGGAPAAPPEGGDALPMDAGASPAMPAASDTYGPADEPAKMARYERVRVENDQLQRRLARLEVDQKRKDKDLDDVRLKMQRRTREADLMKLELNEGIVFKMDDEVEAVAAMSDGDYDAHLVRMRRNYQRVPVGDPIKLAPVAEGGSKPAMTKQERDAKVKMALANRTSFEAALAAN